MSKTRARVTNKSYGQIKYKYLTKTILYYWTCDFRGLKVSQGKVRRINRWGSLSNHISMAYLLSNICTKNYWNQTTIDEIIVRGWVVSFLRLSVLFHFFVILIRAYSWLMYTPCLLYRLFACAFWPDANGESETRKKVISRRKGNLSARLTFFSIFLFLTFCSEWRFPKWILH